MLGITQIHLTVGDCVALQQGAAELIDDLCADEVKWNDGGEFKDCELARYLPAGFEPDEPAEFLRQFLVCAVVTVWKLEAPGRHRLACMAEALALRAIVAKARERLPRREEGVGEDSLGQWYADATSESQVERLFAPGRPVTDANTVRRLMLEHLTLRYWFVPLVKSDYVHLFVADSSEGQAPTTAWNRPRAKA
ncbi:MAG: hypothetical protein ACYC3S_05145 [Chloroflexota bacterium]